MSFQEEAFLNRTSNNYVLFANDKSFIYTSFFADFGPLDLGLTHKFCSQFHETMEKAKELRKPVLYSCSNHPHQRTNSAVLLCAYLVSSYVSAFKMYGIKCFTLTLLGFCP